MSDAAAPLRLNGVTKHLGGALVLDGVDASLERPGVLGVVGENGSGKSTLVRLLAGIYPFEKGDAHVFGRSVRRDRASALAEVGYAPEGTDLPGHLTVSEILALVASLRKARPSTPERVALLDAEPFLGTRIGALSLGQRRRASLLVAMVGGPRLLLLDEPTNGLDADGLSRLRRLMEAHLAGGGSALVVSHDRTFLESLDASILVLPSQRQGARSSG